jgi:endonuclease/exonuclease/phosphatase family metal-dependent hydrolase
VLVRTWNLFHGNSMPPQRQAFLDEMVRLACVDDPDVLCVQEVPGWALSRFTIGDMVSRPPLGKTAGHLITSVNHGVIRSAVAGQGNAIRVLPSLRVLDHHVFVLNPRQFRAELDVSTRVRVKWAKERRIVQAVRLSNGKRTFVVANTHCTGTWPVVAQAELMRAAQFADSVARPDEPLIFAGDFNLRTDSEAMQSLTGPGWGFTAAGPGIDHILVRGAVASEPRVWPPERRRRADGTLLSDHAPVEVEVDLG